MLAIKMSQDEECLARDKHRIVGQLPWISQADHLTPAEINRERFDWTQFWMIHRPPSVRGSGVDRNSGRDTAASPDRVGVECCYTVLPWGQVVNNLSDVTASRNNPIAAGRMRSPHGRVPVSCAPRGAETVDEPYVQLTSLTPMTPPDYHGRYGQQVFPTAIQSSSRPRRTMA